jgi:hypothetical protein
VPSAESCPQDLSRAVRVAPSEPHRPSRAVRVAPFESPPFKFKQSRPARRRAVAPSESRRRAVVAVVMPSESCCRAVRVAPAESRRCALQGRWTRRRATGPADARLAET